MRPYLKNPTRHLAVTELKGKLRAQGFWTGSNTTLYGPATAAAVKAFQAAHLDSEGKFLVVDGEVGPKTWWALDNPSGTAQRSHIKPPTDFASRYGVFSEARQALIRLALSEHAAGVHEIPDGSNRGGGVDKYLAGYGAVPWCALFLSWIVKQVTGGYPLGKVQPHVQTWMNRAKSAKQFFAKGDPSYVPTPGDLMVWVFTRGRGHIAMVVAVDATGKQVNTVGGNEGNRVKLGLRTPAREGTLAGYIRVVDDSPPKVFPRGLLSSADTGGLTADNSR
jgi:hypothetical protein